jgi:8-oxo-dGTP diphosphatase
MIWHGGEVLEFGRCVVDRVRHPLAELRQRDDNAWELVGGNGGVPLLHAEQCPARLSEEPRTEQRSVAAAACVVAMHDGRVLVTRRSAAMRTFAGVYVLPGGHVEPGESLEAAARREMREECGLECAAAPLRSVALYESCFPVEPSEAPRRQHVVAYLLAPLVGELPAVRGAPEETDRFAWRDRAQLARARGPEECGPEECFEARELDGSAVQCRLERLRGRPDAEGRYPQDRLSTGTKMVLQLLLDQNII